MTDISNKTLSVLVGLALVISLVGLFSLPNGIFSITGFGITGEAKINITEYAALNVTNIVIDFGNGTIKSSENNCSLASDALGDPLDCFTPSWGEDGPQSGGFTVENIGNVYLNVTIASTKIASTFWGVSGGKYMYKCSGNGTIDTDAASYIDFTATSQNCTTLLPPGVDVDGFTLDINITIPLLSTGYKNDTITFTGTKS